MKEEVGLSGGAARLFGLYSRKVWWLTHITALYVIEGGTVDFHPNLEVRAIAWVAPDAPPQGHGARHRAASGRACFPCRPQPALVSLAFAGSRA